MQSLLTSYLDQFLQRGDETAFAHRRGLRVIRWSYQKTAETAFQFARELEYRGIAKGDRVILWAKNSPEWIATFFGCLLVGAVVVPLDAHSTEDFVARVQNQVSSRLILCEIPSEVFAQGFQVPVSNPGLFEKSISHYSKARYETSQVTENDLVEIIFTAGTTAEPKGVCLSHKNLLTNLNPLEEEIKKYLKWERPFHPIRFLDLLPLSHIFGQFMGMWVPQLLGGEVFFQNSVNPSDIVRTIKQERISVAIIVPRMLEALQEKVGRDWHTHHPGADLNELLEKHHCQHFARRWWRFRSIHHQFGWKFWAFISGGATLDSETEGFWRKLGFVVVQGYGMTETASLVSVVHPFKLSQGSIGKALPGRELKLDEQGEIMVRGENIAVGRWDNGVKPLTGEDGWLRTGDIGSHDLEGNLFFKGRKKEVIVLPSGMNVYPEDLEAALNQQPEIHRSSVIALDGPRGPEPVAVLILNQTATDIESIINRANAQLNPFQQIRKWFVWPETDFPRTSTQKVRKRDLVERLQDQLQSEASALGPAITPFDFILSTIARITGAAPVRKDVQANLTTDLKLDSLGRVELLGVLEDHYQIELDEAAFSVATTLGEVEQLIRSATLSPISEPEKPAVITSKENLISKPKAAVPYPYPYWSMKFPFPWLRWILFHLIILPITALLCWVRVTGKENLARLSGPVVLIANHVTLTDHALILSALPEKFRNRMAIAMEGELLRSLRYPSTDTHFLKKWWIQNQYFLVVLFFNVFPLPQKSGFRQSFAYLGEAVDRGYHLLIFPEGHRSETGHMAPFRQGIGLVATNLNVPIVPVKINGLYELKHRWVTQHLTPFWTKPGQVSITFGQPVQFSSQDDPEAVTRQLEGIVSQL